METFKIGEKVETPFGYGIITAIDLDLKGRFLYAVKFNKLEKLNKEYVGMCFFGKDLKPYISPHQRLLDLGFEWQKLSSRNSCAYSKYNYPFQDCLTVINVFEDECYLDVNTVGTPELFKILLDYMEELINECANV